MYIIEAEQSFDAAHFLKDYQGACQNIHGHRWRVIARIRAAELSKDSSSRDMVLDFRKLKEALNQMTDLFDHTLIMEEGSLKPLTLQALKEEKFKITVLPFRPTAERFSEHFFNELKKASLPVASVSVYETPGTCATYQEDEP